VGALRQELEFAVLAAFFAYFLCGGKESKCRPAQGQRLKQAKRNADASANTSKPNQPSHDKKITSAYSALSQ
jgi:hypothetical protein